MGLLDLFKGKSKQDEARSTTVVADCPHIMLSPRWDNVGDIGHEDRATGYVCNGCTTAFTVEEVARLRASEKERLQHEMGVKPEVLSRR